MKHEKKDIGELIQEESIAFDVERNRMLETLRRSRLANKYDYVRDLLAAAGENNASEIDVRGLFKTITITDNGDGIPYETLDEKLANIMTGDEIDSLAAGVLSAFDAGIERVEIETAPQGEEAYALEICYDGYEFSVDLLDKKVRRKRGTKVSLQRRKLFDKNPLHKDVIKMVGNLLRNRGIHELEIVRSAGQGARMDISVNGRGIEKEQTEEYFLEHSFEHDEISGHIYLPRDLKIEQTFGRKGFSDVVINKSRLHLFRKGLYHTSFNFPRLQEMFENQVQAGALNAEVNYNKLPVDISGKALSYSNQKTREINRVLRQELIPTFEKVLEMPDSQERRIHLLNFIKHNTTLVRTALERDEAGRDYSHLDFRDYSSELGERARQLFHKIIHEPLFAVKDAKQRSLYKEEPEETTRVSLAELYCKKPFWVDMLVWSKEDLPESMLVIDSAKYGEFPQLAIPNIFRDSQYHVRESKFKRGRRQVLYNRINGEQRFTDKYKERLEEKLKKIPLLHYPALGALITVDMMYNFIAPNHHKNQNPSLEEKLADGFTAVVATSLMLSVIGPALVGGGAVYGSYKTLEEYVGTPLKNKALIGAEKAKPLLPYIQEGSKAGKKAARTTLALTGTALIAPIMATGIGIKYLGSAALYLGGKTFQGVEYIANEISPPVANTLRDWRAKRKKSLQERRAHKKLSRKDKKTRKEREKEQQILERKEQKSIPFREIAQRPNFPPGSIEILVSHSEVSELFRNRYHKAIFQGFSHIYPKSYDGGQIYINTRDSAIKKIHAMTQDVELSPAAQTLIGSYMINEGSLCIRDSFSDRVVKPNFETILDFQTAFLEEGISEFYDEMTAIYQQGTAEEFSKRYTSLPVESRQKVIEKILPLERNHSIDSFLEQEDSPLLREAWDQYIKTQT